MLVQRLNEISERMEQELGERKKMVAYSMGSSFRRIHEISPPTLTEAFSLALELVQDEIRQPGYLAHFQKGYKAKPGPTS
jgi:hypothetical protein